MDEKVYVVSQRYEYGDDSSPIAIFRSIKEAENFIFDSQRQDENAGLKGWQYKINACYVY